MSTDKTTIKIPKQLYEKVKNHIQDTGFSSPTQFIVHVLRDVLAGGSLEEDELTREEVQKVRKRLEKLGYLGR